MSEEVTRTTYFTPTPSFSAGQKVHYEARRSALAIWKDRLKRLRWNVPTTELRTYTVTSVVGSDEQTPF